MSFKSNAIAMLTGTVMAQALPLLTAPVLTRLYSPEAFGLQTLFMGLAASLAVLATCRMDLAIVLPESDSEVLPIAGFVLFSALLVSAITWFAVPLVGMATGRALPDAWLWLLPLMVFLIAMYQLSVGLASRRSDFRGIATAGVGNQFSYVAAALAFGLASGWSLGLVLAKAAGQALGLVLLARASAAQILAAASRWSFARVLAVAARYRQFLLFNTPYSVVGSVARDAPVYIFSALAAMGAAGFFGLARTVLLAPTLLVSNAFSQVFYREAVALNGSPRLQELTLTLLRLGLTALAPVFAFCAVWGDALFVTVFGERWRDAGTFSMALAPAAWMAVQTGWPERLFEVNGRQGVSFVLQLGSDATTAVIFAAVYLLSGRAILAVCAFAACNLVYHHAYLLAIFRISGFAVATLVRVLASGWLVFAVCCVALIALRQQTGAGGNAGWIAGLLLSGSGAALIGWRSARKGLGAAGGS